jgi:RHS repeat-associated protein
VAAITDKNGAVVERYNYSPYGEATILDAAGTTVLGASTIANPWTFTGRRLDAETGLMYYRARYYDPQLGRFAGRDPIDNPEHVGIMRGEVSGAVGQDYSLGQQIALPEYLSGTREAVAISLYEYVLSNPVRLVDPMGLKSKDCTTVVIETSPVRFPPNSGIVVARHSSVVAKCRGQLVTTRWEDRGPEESDSTYNDRLKETTVPKDYLDPSKKEYPWGDWQRYSVTCKQGESCCETWKCLKKAFDTAQLQKYPSNWQNANPFGNPINSNTFAHSLLNKCGCAVNPAKIMGHGSRQLPRDVPGWDTPPPNFWPNESVPPQSNFGPKVPSVK